LYLTNGERFFGKFKTGMMNGCGKFFIINGKVIEGVWKNNKLVKEF